MLSPSHLRRQRSRAKDRDKKTCPVTLTTHGGIWSCCYIFLQPKKCGMQRRVLSLPLSLSLSLSLSLALSLSLFLSFDFSDSRKHIPKLLNQQICFAHEMDCPNSHRPHLRPFRMRDRKDARHNQDNYWCSAAKNHRHVECHIDNPSHSPNFFIQYWKVCQIE